MESGRGKNSGGAMGPGGFCICVKCDYEVSHQRNVKCTELKCPLCGHRMIRKELLVKNK